MPQWDPSRDAGLEETTMEELHREEEWLRAHPIPPQHYMSTPYPRGSDSARLDHQNVAPPRAGSNFVHQPMVDQQHHSQGYDPQRAAYSSASGVPFPGLQQNPSGELLSPRPHPQSGYSGSTGSVLSPAELSAMNETLRCGDDVLATTRQAIGQDIFIDIHDQ